MTTKGAVGRSRRHVRIDDDPAPRLDFRLTGPAIGVWVGSAVGLSGQWGVVAPTVLILLLLSIWCWRYRLGHSIGAVGRGSVRTGVIGVRDFAVGRSVLATVAALVAGLVVAACAFSSAAHDPLIAAGRAGSWADFQGVVDDFPVAVRSKFPATDSSGAPIPSVAVTLAADSVQVAGRSWRPAAAVTVLGSGPGWSKALPGTKISFGGLLRSDDRAVLPAVTVQARDPPQVRAGPPWWQAAAGALRSALVANSAGLDEDAKGLLPGLVVGDTTAIPDQLTTDAKSTGLTHLLAVSGSHFVLLCGAAILLFRRFGARVALLGSAVTATALVVLVGSQPSVLRAAVMVGVSLIGAAVGRPRTALPALSGAVFVLVLWRPELAAAPGFALSVGATAALVLLAPIWAQGLRRRGWPIGWAGLVTVPAAAGLVTMPMIVALSGSVSLASIPANLLAEPVVAPALVIGLLGGVVGVWWPLGGRLLARADQPLLDWIAGVAHRMSRWSLATVPWPASVTGVLTLAGLTLAGLFALRHRRVRAAVVAASVGAAIILVPAQLISLGWPPPNWLIVACEVGQGDGMVLATGEPGVAVIVDTGPDPALMDGCLERLGVTSIPLLVLTHLHADHVDGLPGTLAGRMVGAIGVGPDRDPAAAWIAVNEQARQAGVPVIELPPGTSWASGRLRVTVLGPSAAFHGTDSDPNNDSVTMLATIDGQRILMTGDIETEAQQKLLDAGADLRADVLEQPHHGSAKILPAFTQAVSPSVSLIGVGLDNDYGQPNRKALEQLSAIGATVLRTDTQGDAAVCLIDGRLQVATRGAALRGSTPTPGGDE